MVRIQELYDAGDLKGARQQQFRMTPLAKGVTARYGIGGLKAAMDLVGHYGGKPRSPLPAPGLDEIEDLKKMLRELEII
jgi:4-hydroxy-2-oxoglutarate aldolase